MVHKSLASSFAHMIQINALASALVAPCLTLSAIPLLRPSSLIAICFSNSLHIPFLPGILAQTWSRLVMRTAVQSYASTKLHLPWCMVHQVMDGLNLCWIYLSLFLVTTYPKDLHPSQQCQAAVSTPPASPPEMAFSRGCYIQNNLVLHLQTIKEMADWVHTLSFLKSTGQNLANALIRCLELVITSRR